MTFNPNHPFISLLTPTRSTTTTRIKHNEKTMGCYMPPSHGWDTTMPFKSNPCHYPLMNSATHKSFNEPAHTDMAHYIATTIMPFLSAFSFAFPSSGPLAPNFPDRTAKAHSEDKSTDLPDPNADATLEKKFTPSLPGPDAILEKKFDPYMPDPDYDPFLDFLGGGDGPLYCKGHCQGGYGFAAADGGSRAGQWWWTGM